MAEATTASHVATVLRIIGALGVANIAANLVTVAITPLWQYMAMAGASVLVLFAVAAAWRTHRRGDPTRALERLYAGCFAAVGLSIPLARGTHALVAVGLATLVLTTAPLILPLTRVDRWAQTAVAFGLIAAAFDVIELPTQLAINDPGFEILVFVAVGIFGLLAARNFHRFPVKTKLTLAFLAAALLPLLAASYLRQAYPVDLRLLVIAVAGGASLFAFAFGHLLATPLSTVAQAMGRFTAGDIQARASVRSRDEIGEVSDRFNGLAAELGRVLASLREEVVRRTQKEIELQAAIADLATARDTLEARVRERTQELEANNRNLAETLDELRRAQAQLVQSEKMASLGLLVAGIAHEIKNPLNFVNNFAELALDFVEEHRARRPSEAGEDDGTLDEVAYNIQRIREHGRRADRIINTMLMHARSRSDETSAVDLNAMAFENVGLAYQSFRAGDRAFTLEIVADLDPAIGQVKAPSQELARVVVNLVSNACYAMRERLRSGVPQYRPLLRFSTRREGLAVTLVVSDNGTGVAPEALSRLFDPFFTTKPPGEGTGLGLSLSYEIVVKQLGGSLTVASEPGAGATFTLRLPALPPV